MSIFDSIKDKVLSIFDNSGWVKWIHEGTPPAYTQNDRVANVELASKSNHCAMCLNLNGCCFPKSNMPVYPHHPNCHCKLEPATNINFKAECSIDKFTKYAFVPRDKDDKSDLFKNLGYDIMDSQWLAEEYCRQAQEKYAKGEFKLNELDKFGQRINIEITLPQKDGSGSVTFESGWMVCPNGTILLTTPFARRDK